ncbi:MAG: InlB B-repeat-containing protein [Flavobacteriales bacterium]|jgi:hypothetical protein|tara:strand:- start:5045 stop:6076 length:1032 start_codon:yes stop_codon:yes gene_type:complete
MKKIFLFIGLISIISCSKDPVIHTLFTSSNPIIGGSVSPSKAEYSNGESAEITASASSEYIFQSWTGASGIDSKTSVVMDMDKLVTANFVKKKYALNTEVEGEGSIKETLIKSGAITNYNSGTVIELEAIPSNGWKFIEWKGDITGNKNPYIITLNSNKLVKSIFKKEDTGGGGSGAVSNSPIDFETGGYGADWTWTVFENDSNPPLEIVSNPNSSGINNSSKVAKITALKTGAPYVGCESKHGTDIGTFKFDSKNSIVKMMVYKSVISDVGLKFAEVNGEAQPEVKVANTKINEWEELTFDLSGSIGKGITGIIDQIIIFPDFNARTTDNVIYFDNITFGSN